MINIFRRGDCNNITNFYKFILCMKLIFTISLICTIQSYAGIYAQDSKISLEMSDTELKSVFKEIKKQSDFDFVYNEEIDDKKNVSINIKDASIDEVMDDCLKNHNYNYEINNKIIVITKKQVQQKQQNNGFKITGKVTDKKGAPLPGVSVIIKGTYRGVTTDKNGMYNIVIPDPKGVSLKFTFIGMKKKIVKINNRNLINVTLEDNPEDLDEITVIYDGMQKIDHERVTGAISVVKTKDLLDEGVTSLDQALEGKIVGINATTISGEIGVRSKITIRGENSLNGNTEPLWIVDGLPMTTGVPKNSSGDFAGTIMQDGVGNIMPEDIATVTFLKDADGAAIYGAKAANGVIVITTKKGFRSKTKFSYSGNFKYSIKPDVEVDFMNAAEKLQYETDLINDFGIDYALYAGRGGRLYKRYYDGFMTKAEYDAEITRLSDINTNWLDEIFKPSYSQSHNLSIRGGNETLSYYTSLSFTDQQGILEPNKGGNSGVRMNLQYRPIPKLIVDFSIAGNSRYQKNHAANVNPFNYAIFANRYERPYDDNGNYDSDLTYIANNNTELSASGFVYDSFNIMKELNDTKRRTDGLDLSLTLNVRYTLMKGINIQSIFRRSMSQNSSMTEIYPDTYTSYKQEPFANEVYNPDNDPDILIPSMYNNGKLSESSGKNKAWSMRNQIDISRTLFDNHLFSLLFANEVTSRDFNNFNYSSPIYDPEYRITGIPFFENNEIKYEDMRSIIRGMYGTSDGTDRTVSFLGRLRYSYKDRYVLNFSSRADAADVIGDDNKFTPLWSMGSRWNVHKEQFFSPITNYINQLSFRFSYGFTGNIDRTAYPFSTITMGSSKYLDQIYAKKFTFPNPSVSWSKKRSYNFGVNFAVLNNRVSISSNYYKNKTVDILTNLRVPNATGRSYVKINGGEVENKGMELSVSIRWIRTKNFSFFTSANIARNINIVNNSLYGLKSYKDAIKHGSSKGGVLSIMGEETGSIYGWKSAGVHPESGYPMYYLSDEGKKEYAKILDKWDTYDNNFKSFLLRTGMIPTLTEIPDKVAIRRNISDIKYGDFRNMLMESMQYIGRSNPKYVGGFTTTMRYKNLSLVTRWSYKLGHKVRSFDDIKRAPKNHQTGRDKVYGSTDFYVSNTNREKKYLYRWRNKGDYTNVPNFINSNDFYSTMHMSDDYQDGDYLRLRSLILKYRLPNKVSKKLGLNNMNISFSANNIYTFTKYQGFDVATGGSFRYPQARTFNVRLSLGF